MKNKNKKPVEQLPPPRSTDEITSDYTRLCAEFGNKSHQFEIEKSRFFSACIRLNDEMQLALAAESKREAELKANLEKQGEQLVNLVADEVASR